MIAAPIEHPSLGHEKLSGRHNLLNGVLGVAPTLLITLFFLQFSPN